MNLFKDIIPSILVTGEPVLHSQEEYKDYVPFMVNRAISQHIDCIFIVNEMNLYPSADKAIQYTWLLNTCRHYKRPFVSWAKKESIDNLDIVKQYYGYNDMRAREALTILTCEQIEQIKEQLDKGGKQ